MEYPEHEKMMAVKQESNTIGNFLDWLYHEKKYSICYWEESEGNGVSYMPERYYSIRQSFNDLLADFFDIDLKKVEEEKDVMLDQIRSQ